MSIHQPFIFSFVLLMSNLNYFCISFIFYNIQSTIVSSFLGSKPEHRLLCKKNVQCSLICYLLTYHAALNGLQPYLHESRHIHALNRVRGSGGRFLSKKKLQESDPTPSQCNVTDTIHSHVKNDASELESYQSGTGQSGASNTTCSDITSVSYSNVTFRQPERRFSGIATHLGGGMEINSRLICRGTQHHTSVVQ